MPLNYAQLLGKLRDEVPAIESMAQLHALLGLRDGDSADALFMVPTDVLLRVPVVLREMVLAATLQGYVGQALNDVQADIMQECFDALADAKMLATINRAAARLGATRK